MISTLDHSRLIVVKTALNGVAVAEMLHDHRQERQGRLGGKVAGCLAFGIGVQGFADLLMRLRLPFESKGAIQLNRCGSSILSPPAALFCFGSLSPFRFCFSVSVRVFISLSESGFFHIDRAFLSA